MKSKISNVTIREYNDREDRGSILAIERTCLWNAWDDSDFEATMQDPFNFTLVAEVKNGSSTKIVGYVNFDLTDPSLCPGHGCLRHIYLYRIAVLPAYRRAGIGRQLIEKIKERLSHQGASELHTSLNDEVRKEGKLKACWFFRACGMMSPVDFECPSFYKDSETLVVPFTYTLPGGTTYKNRCAKYFFSPTE